MCSSRHFWIGYRPLSSLWILMMLAACSAFPTQQSSFTKQTPGKSTPTVVLGAAHCQPPSPISTIGIPEVQGTTSGKTELWALLFNEMVVNKEVKIVWRMTGDGDMQIAAHGPRGEIVKAKWITYHGSSTWSRPGLEWGTGFVLPESGCWEFSVNRVGASGQVWLLVK